MAEQRFHVFLSYNSSDQGKVQLLAERLKQEGIKAWLATENLIAGDDWQEKIEAALRSCDTCAILIGESGLTSNWQKAEMRIAIDRKINTGSDAFRVFPVFLPGASLDLLPPLLSQYQWVEFPTLEDTDAFNQLRRAILGVTAQQRTNKQNPYRGLHSFEIEHAPFFFGREALKQEILVRLESSISRSRQMRFIALVGSSGSGKSSVAKAGVLAAVRADHYPGSSKWPCIVCRPGSDPLRSTAIALEEAFARQPILAVVSDTITRMRADAGALDLALRVYLEKGMTERRALVLVDQFEECFTLCRDKKIREEFFENLIHAASTPDGPAVILITLRVDELKECLDYPGLRAALQDAQVLVGPMSEQEMRQAIECPAEKVGTTVKPALTQELLDDVRDQPGALPLLQYALEQLWNKSETDDLTVELYQKHGQVRGMLEAQANGVLQYFDEKQKSVCKHVFLKLVQPIDGSRYTRCRVALSKIVAKRFPEALVLPVVHALAAENARLLTIEGDVSGREPVIEIAHEELIRSWPLLGQWLKEDQKSRLWHARLKRLGRWISIAAAVVGLVFGAALVQHYWRKSESQALAERVTQMTRGDEDRRIPVLLALHALARAYTTQAEQSLHLALQFARVAIREHVGTVKAVAYSRDGKKIATGGVDRTVRVWEAGTYDDLGAFPSQSEVASVALSSDGKLLASGSGNGLINIWGLPSPCIMGKPGISITKVVFDSEGKHLFSTSLDQTLRVWDVKACREERKLIDGDTPLTALAISSDGNWLAAGDKLGGIRLWDTRSYSELPPIKAHQKIITDLAFSRDGTRLVTASHDDTAQLWDLVQRRSMAVINRAGDGTGLSGVAFSPGDKKIITISLSGLATVWDADTGRRMLTLAIPESDRRLTAVASPAVSPDNSTEPVAIAGMTRSDDGLVRVYELNLKEAERQAEQIAESLKFENQRELCQKLFQTDRCSAIPKRRTRLWSWLRFWQ